MRRLEEDESSTILGKKERIAKKDCDFINWSFGKEPVIPDRNFTGLNGTRHGLNAATAKPFDYFPLFIPIFFYNLCATYTNTKADLECSATSEKNWI
jgi:hypothetical protein